MIRRLNILSKNPVTILLLSLFLYPLLKGFILKFSKEGLEKELLSVEESIILLVAIIIGITYGRKIFVYQEIGIYKDIYNFIPLFIKTFIEGKPIYIFFIIIPIIIVLTYMILLGLVNILNKISFYPILSGIEKGLKEKSSISKRLLGLIFQIPRGISYVIIGVFVLNIYFGFAKTPKLDIYLESSQPYKYVNENVISKISDSEIGKKIPELLSDSFKVVIKKADSSNKELIYYNGVTLDEGIKSNEEIDAMGRKLVSGQKGTKEKGKIIYKWIGSNINYDNEKAERILSNNFKDKSGAIIAFNTKRGICFDYACLYVAMCRANNIKVRLITGEGYNGESWIGHAWNQIYIENEDKWINVDPTFYAGGNYYNSARFLIDHRNEEIAGEW